MQSQFLLKQFNTEDRNREVPNSSLHPRRGIRQPSTNKGNGIAPGQSDRLQEFKLISVLVRKLLDRASQYLMKLIIKCYFIPSVIREQPWF